jgi:hypothetical protein
LRAAETAVAQAGMLGIPSGIFPHIYQGLEQAGTAFTCRQGDFAEDLSG